MITQNEKNTALLTHLSTFLSFFFPFGSILGPLIMWVVTKDKSEFLNKNGAEALNFNLSYTLYVVILALLFFPFAIGTLFGFVSFSEGFANFYQTLGMGSVMGLFGIGGIFLILVFLRFVLIIAAAIKGNRGEVFKYPLSINFVK